MRGLTDFLIIRAVIKAVFDSRGAHAWVVIYMQMPSHANMTILHLCETSRLPFPNRKSQIR